jgi:hypothetical protein
MNIGEAVKALKEGKFVQRSGWNGKGMHIYLEDEHIFAKGTGSQRKYEASIVLFNAQRTHQPGWNASTPDLLADDWQLVDMERGKLAK